MPYVVPSEANNSRCDSIQAIMERNGPGLWREQVTASPEHRVLLLSWPPGYDNSTHYHPDAIEVFVIHNGRAEFEFADGQLVDAKPGSILYTSPGFEQRHAIRVVGDEPLVMLCFLSPNAPDDTVDC